MADADGYCISRGMCVRPHRNLTSDGQLLDYLSSRWVLVARKFGQREGIILSFLRGDVVKYLQHNLSLLCALLVLMSWPASATDVAFIVNDVGLTNPGDVVINDILIERGFSVTLVSQNEDAETTLAAANAADLAIVSESVGSGNVNTEVKDSTSPVLLYEPYLYDDFQWMPGDAISNNFDPTDNGGNTLPDTASSVTIVQPDHPLAAGFPAGDVEVYTGPGELAYGRLTADGANIVATVPGFPDTATIFTFDEGDVALDGTTIPARRVGFFAAGLTLSNTEFTEDGRSLFDAALNFALGFSDVPPGDFNSDGAIDLTDFAILAENFNTDGAFSQGDNDFSGRIDLRDFAQFRKLFNASNPGLAAVPEPSSWLLIICGLTCLARIRAQARQIPASACPTRAPARRRPLAEVPSDWHSDHSPPTPQYPEAVARTVKGRHGA